MNKCKIDCLNIKIQFRNIVQQENKMKKLIISIVAALLLLAAFLPTAVLADTSGNSAGSFSIGVSAPTVNSVVLYEANGTTPATSMTPQTPYVFQIDVTDLNGFSHMNTVRMVVFYSPTTPNWASPAVLLTLNASVADTIIHITNTSGFIAGNKVLIKDTALNEYNTIASVDVGANTLTMVTPLSHAYSIAAGFRATVTNFHDLPVTPDSQTVAQFNWIKASNSWVVSYPSIDNTTSTWSSRNFTTPDLTNLTLNNFVFQGEFTPGKVASAGNWYIRVRTTDDQNNDGRGNTSAILMNPYDEIVLDTTSLAWGQVNPGLAFGDAPNPKEVMVKYIANGGL